METILLYETSLVEITADHASGEATKRFKQVDNECLARFRAEVRFLLLLGADSGCVAPLLRVVEAPPIYAVVLPYFRVFESLDLVLHEHGRASVRPAWRMCLARDCVAAVSHAHSCGVVLRDMKCANPAQPERF